MLILLKMRKNILKTTFILVLVCNVMVTRPTNHMILTRDHSHDLLT